MQTYTNCSSTLSTLTKRERERGRENQQLFTFDWLDFSQVDEKHTHVCHKKGRQNQFLRFSFIRRKRKKRKNSQMRWNNEVISTLSNAARIHCSARIHLLMRPKRRGKQRVDWRSTDMTRTRQKKNAAENGSAIHPIHNLKATINSTRMDTFWLWIEENQHWQSARWLWLKEEEEGNRYHSAVKWTLRIPTGY